jgi:DNA-directed RNA polymerase subunit RPC12/RpoP
MDNGSSNRERERSTLKQRALCGWCRGDLLITEVADGYTMRCPNCNKRLLFKVKKGFVTQHPLEDLQ